MAPQGVGPRPEEIDVDPHQGLRRWHRPRSITWTVPSARGSASSRLPASTPGIVTAVIGVSFGRCLRSLPADLYAACREMAAPERMAAEHFGRRKGFPGVRENLGIELPAILRSQ